MEIKNIIVKILSHRQRIAEIRTMTKVTEPPIRDTVRALEKKLDKCRNQENNPDSDM